MEYYWMNQWRPEISKKYYRPVIRRNCFGRVDNRRITRNNSYRGRCNFRSSASKYEDDTNSCLPFEKECSIEESTNERLVDSVADGEEAPCFSLPMKMADPEDDVDLETARAIKEDLLRRPTTNFEIVPMEISSSEEENEAPNTPLSKDSNKSLPKNTNKSSSKDTNKSLSDNTNKYLSNDTNNSLPNDNNKSFSNDTDKSKDSFFDRMYKTASFDFLGSSNTFQFTKIKKNESFMKRALTADEKTNSAHERRKSADEKQKTIDKKRRSTNERRKSLEERRKRFGERRKAVGERRKSICEKRESISERLIIDKVFERNCKIIVERRKSIERRCTSINKKRKQFYEGIKSSDSTSEDSECDSNQKHRDLNESDKLYLNKTDISDSKTIKLLDSTKTCEIESSDSDFTNDIITKVNSDSNKTEVVNSDHNFTSKTCQNNKLKSALKDLKTTVVSFLVKQSKEKNALLSQVNLEEKQEILQREHEEKKQTQQKRVLEEVEVLTQDVNQLGKIRTPRKSLEVCSISEDKTSWEETENSINSSVNIANPSSLSKSSVINISSSEGNLSNFSVLNDTVSTHIIDNFSGLSEKLVKSLTNFSSATNNSTCSSEHILKNSSCSSEKTISESSSSSEIILNESSGSSQTALICASGLSERTSYNCSVLKNSSSARIEDHSSQNNSVYFSSAKINQHSSQENCSTFSSVINEESFSQQNHNNFSSVKIKEDSSKRSLNTSSSIKIEDNSLQRNYKTASSKTIEEQFSRIYCNTEDGENIKRKNSCPSLDKNDSTKLPTDKPIFSSVKNKNSSSQQNCNNFSSAKIVEYSSQKNSDTLSSVKYEVKSSQKNYKTSSSTAVEQSSQRNCNTKGAEIIKRRHSSAKMHSSLNKNSSNKHLTDNPKIKERRSTSATKRKTSSEGEEKKMKKKLTWLPKNRRVIQDNTDDDEEIKIVDRILRDYKRKSTREEFKPLKMQKKNEASTSDLLSTLMGVKDDEEEIISNPKEINANNKDDSNDIIMGLIAAIGESASAEISSNCDINFIDLTKNTPKSIEKSIKNSEILIKDQKRTLELHNEETNLTNKTPELIHEETISTMKNLELIHEETSIITKKKPELLHKETVLMKKPEMQSEEASIITKMKSELPHEITLTKETPESLHDQKPIITKKKPELLREENTVTTKSTLELLQKETVSPRKTLGLIHKETIILKKTPKLYNEETVLMKKAPQLLPDDAIVAKKTAEIIVEKEINVRKKSLNSNTEEIVLKDSLTNSISDKNVSCTSDPTSIKEVVNPEEKRQSLKCSISLINHALKGSDCVKGCLNFLEDKKLTNATKGVHLIKEQKSNDPLHRNLITVDLTDEEEFDNTSKNTNLIVDLTDEEESDRTPKNTNLVVDLIYDSDSSEEEPNNSSKANADLSVLENKLELNRKISSESFEDSCKNVGKIPMGVINSEIKINRFQFDSENNEDSQAGIANSEENIVDSVGSSVDEATNENNSEQIEEITNIDIPKKKIKSELISEEEFLAKLLDDLFCSKDDAISVLDHLTFFKIVHPLIRIIRTTMSTLTMSPLGSIYQDMHTMLMQNIKKAVDKVDIILKKVDVLDFKCEEIVECVKGFSEQELDGFWVDVIVLLGVMHEPRTSFGKALRKGLVDECKLVSLRKTKLYTEAIKLLKSYDEEKVEVIKVVLGDISVKSEAIEISDDEEEQVMKKTEGYVTPIPTANLLDPAFRSASESSTGANTEDVHINPPSNVDYRREENANTKEVNSVQNEQQLNNGCTMPINNNDNDNLEQQLNNNGNLDQQLNKNVNIEGPINNGINFRLQLNNTTNLEPQSSTDRCNLPQTSQSYLPCPPSCQWRPQCPPPSNNSFQHMQRIVDRQLPPTGPEFQPRFNYQQPRTFIPPQQNFNYPLASQQQSTLVSPQQNYPILSEQQRMNQNENHQQSVITKEVYAKDTTRQVHPIMNSRQAYPNESSGQASPEMLKTLEAQRKLALSRQAILNAQRYMDFMSGVSPEERYRAYQMQQQRIRLKMQEYQSLNTKLGRHGIIGQTSPMFPQKQSSVMEMPRTYNQPGISQNPSGDQVPRVIPFPLPSQIRYASASQTTNQGQGLKTIPPAHQTPSAYSNVPPNQVQVPSSQQYQSRYTNITENSQNYPNTSQSSNENQLSRTIPFPHSFQSGYQNANEVQVPKTLNACNKPQKRKRRTAELMLPTTLPNAQQQIQQTGINDQQIQRYNHNLNQISNRETLIQGHEQSTIINSKHQETHIINNHQQNSISSHQQAQNQVNSHLQNPPNNHKPSSMNQQILMNRQIDTDVQNELNNHQNNSMDTEQTSMIGQQKTFIDHQQNSINTREHAQTPINNHRQNRHNNLKSPTNQQILMNHQQISMNQLNTHQKNPINAKLTMIDQQNTFNKHEQNSMNTLKKTSKSNEQNQINTALQTKLSTHKNQIDNQQKPLVTDHDQNSKTQEILTNISALSKKEDAKKLSVNMKFAIDKIIETYMNESQNQVNNNPQTLLNHQINSNPQTLLNNQINNRQNSSSNDHVFDNQCVITKLPSEEAKKSNSTIRTINYNQIEPDSIRSLEQIHSELSKVSQEVSILEQQYPRVKITQINPQPEKTMKNIVQSNQVSAEVHFDAVNQQFESSKKLENVNRQSRENSRKLIDQQSKSSKTAECGQQSAQCSKSSTISVYNNQQSATNSGKSKCVNDQSTVFDVIPIHYYFDGKQVVLGQTKKASRFIKSKTDAKLLTLSNKNEKPSLLTTKTSEKKKLSTISNKNKGSLDSLATNKTSDPKLLSMPSLSQLIQPSEVPHTIGSSVSTNNLSDRVTELHIPDTEEKITEFLKDFDQNTIIEELIGSNRKDLGLELMQSDRVDTQNLSGTDNLEIEDQCNEFNGNHRVSQLQRTVSTDSGCFLSPTLEDCSNKPDSCNSGGHSDEFSYCRRYECICGKEADMLCECKGAIYCSVDCQLADWSNHRIKCTSSLNL